MQRRSVGLAVAAFGIVVVVVAALADQIGIGDSDAFGWRQVLGVVVGVVIAVSGVVMAMQSETPADGADTGA